MRISESDAANATHSMIERQTANATLQMPQCGCRTRTIVECKNCLKLCLARAYTVSHTPEKTITQGLEFVVAAADGRALSRSLYVERCPLQCCLGRFFAYFDYGAASMTAAGRDAAGRSTPWTQQGNRQQPQ